MQLFWRIASLVFVSLMFVVLVPVNWSRVDWGTAPEWICAAALVAIAAAVWRSAVPANETRRRRGSRVG